MNLETSVAISHIYSEINNQVASFQASTGLHCPPGCGKCCENPEVEVSPLEMVPMALEIIRRGEVQQWLDLIAAAPLPGRCVCYKPHDYIPGYGRCQLYMWRPALCRLFGFAAMIDKTGTPKLAACAVHKHQAANTIAMTQVSIANGLPIPHFADWQTRIANLDPHWGHQRLPINQALQIALEKLSLRLSYETQNSGNAIAAVGQDPAIDCEQLSPDPEISPFKGTSSNGD